MQAGSEFVQRWKCKSCAKKFSAATFKPTYRQKTRRINATVRFGLASNMCQRDIAEPVGVDMQTVAARLIWQAKLSRAKNDCYIKAFIDYHGPIKCVQFDDLLTFEHTNCKPLTLNRTWAGEVKNVSVLVAIGVGSEGYSKILGVQEGHKEDKAGWSEFLRYLKERGLKDVKLIISDACMGLYESVGDYYPEADLQRCMVHFHRNVANHVPSTKLKEVARMLKPFIRKQAVRRQ